MKNQCTFKATIVGCGSVGATTAYAYLLSGNVTDLTLIDIDAARARGLELDLEHAKSYTPFTQVESTDDLSKASGSNVVVITAGRRQKEGETRLDLVNANKAIFADIIPKLAKAAPNAVFIIVSNPVDVLTYESIKHSGLPWTQVFGSGTILDSARLQFHISEKIGIHPSSIDAYILGEHGDTSFPVYSSANILGKPLRDFDRFSDELAAECYQDTKNAAYRIIHDQGYTCYSIATAVREITFAIFEDKNAVFPVSVLLNNYYGHSGVCLSVPCVIGRSGIKEVIEVPLDENEQEKLTKSVNTIKEFL